MFVPEELFSIVGWFSDDFSPSFGFSHSLLSVDSFSDLGGLGSWRNEAFALEVLAAQNPVFLAFQLLLLSQRLLVFPVRQQRSSGRMI